MSAPLAERFAALADRWKWETRLTSSSTAIVAHPAYQEIIRMGEAAVPLILADLEREPHFWGAALREITGANPVHEAIRGRVRQMAEAWLAWGREQGYRWDQEG